MFTQDSSNKTGGGQEGFSLPEVEEHFAELVAGVEDHAIFLLDPTGNVTSWNAGARRMKGYEAGEIIGKSFQRFYPQAAIEAGWPEEELRRAKAEGRIQDEGWRLRKDGSRFWANVVITALWTKEGELRGFLKITRDLTDRRQAEETVRQSEERLRLMIESVQDYAIYILDPEGYITTWNQGAQRIKGYSAEEVIGQHFSIFYSSEDLAKGMPALELAAAKRDGRAEDEGWRVRKDRSHFWANAIITALYDSQGTFRGFAKITRDLTDKVRMDELKVADKQKNAFLAMLAHELRNPLAPIRNGVELIKISCRELPALKETTSMMERQVVHLVRLVDDLLDVSRIITGKIHLEKEAVDIREVVKRAVEEIQPAIDARGHELLLTLPSKALTVEGDVVRLAQVVSNLLANSAKYTDTPSQIHLTAEIINNEAVVRVTDSGIGMTEEELPRVFGLFEQTESAVSRFRGGLGIGLTLVKQIVEMHEGSVFATSRGPGQGSEFGFRLPLVQTSDARGHSDDGFMKRQSDRRILIVDDNVDAATSVAALVKMWGHEVEVAFSGREALEKARMFRPNLVFLDIGMPGMSGYDVAKQLRRMPEFAGVTITALTGYGQAEDRRRSHEAGFNFHLTKPPKPDQLASLIASPETFKESTS